MSNPAKQFVITASDLFNGDVVYFTAGLRWAGSLNQAALAADRDGANALLALANQQQHKIVGPYITDVTLDGAGLPQPIHFREAFRARGPSNYFHGKQAEV